MRLRAVQIFQSVALATQQAILTDALLRAGLTPSADQVQAVYNQTLRAQTEQTLAALADENPKLAAQLRQILSVELDR